VQRVKHSQLKLLLVGLPSLFQRLRFGAEPICALPFRSRERSVCHRHTDFGTLERFGAVRSILTDLLTLKILHTGNRLSCSCIPRGGRRRALQFALQRLGTLCNPLNLCLTHARHR